MVAVDAVVADAMFVLVTAASVVAAVIVAVVPAVASVAWPFPLNKLWRFLFPFHSWSCSQNSCENRHIAIVVPNLC